MPKLQPQTRTAGMVLLIPLFTVLSGWLGYDIYAYFDSLPENTLTAFVVTVCNTPLEKFILALAIQTVAILLIGHFCLGWWIGKGTVS